MPLEVSLVNVGGIEVDANRREIAEKIGRSMVRLGNALQNPNTVFRPRSYFAAKEGQEDNTFLLLLMHGDNGKQFPIGMMLRHIVNENDLFEDSP